MHPGSAYLRMQNAILMAMELNALLPANERPEHTREYEGFYHLNDLEGTVESARMVYIIRDHDRARFEQKKEYLQSCVDFLNRKYGKQLIRLELRDQYYNMKEKIEPVFHIVELAQQAMLETGVTPLIKPVRGGLTEPVSPIWDRPAPIFLPGVTIFTAVSSLSAWSPWRKPVR